MKSMPRTLTLAAVAFLLVAAATPDSGVKTGAAAPDFSLPGNDGKTYKLSDFKGKVVVLEWLNHGCPIDAKHYASTDDQLKDSKNHQGDEKGNMQVLQKFAKDKNVVWLSIISSAPGQQGYVDVAGATADIKKFGKSPTVVLLDPTGKVGHQYDAKTTPHMYIIDKDGKLVYQGGIDSANPSNVAAIAKSTPYFKNALDEVLAGKPVANADTKPYGCNVKYAP